MTLKELIVEAAKVSPEFSSRYNWWVCNRKKAPELGWLMKQLEKALGAPFLDNAAQEEIDAQEANLEIQ